MYAGPVEAGATIVTSVALAAARSAVKQQVQYNEAIQKSAESKPEYAKAKDSNAGSSKASKNSISNGGPGQSAQSAQSVSGSSQAAFTGGAPQSIATSRGSRMDISI